VEAFARFETSGGRAPRPMVVPHELSRCRWRTDITPRVGGPRRSWSTSTRTGNASTAIITAAGPTSDLHVGRADPITEEGLPGARDLHIHWAQESFDQAAMLREYVKWTTSSVARAGRVRGGRAFELMLAEPAAPSTSRCA